MKNIKLINLNKSHEKPEDFLNNITKLTFNTKLNRDEDIEYHINQVYNESYNILKNVIDMNHTSILEHVTVSYLIQGASRSLLAQITRHRLFSFLSASQHYMDYSTMADFVVPVEIEEKGNDEVLRYLNACKQSVVEYKELIDRGIDHSVARQVLPNGMRNQLIITGNLRQWGHFLNLRLCGRNTSEIEYIAYLIRQDLLEYIPMLDTYMTPDCIKVGKCTQGTKSCGIIYSDDNERKKFAKVLKR